MVDQPTLTVVSRAGVGSGASRKLRRQGMVPAVVYGHGDPAAVAVEAAHFQRIVSPEQFGSQIVHLQVDARDAGLALVKSVQLNTLTHQLLSIELQRVSSQERLHVSVAIVLEGEPAGARGGGVLEQFMHSVNLRCRATDVPAALHFDISPLHVGDSVHVAQLALPADCELLDKPDDVVVMLAPPTKMALEEPAVTEGGVTGPELTGEAQQDDSQLAT